MDSETNHERPECRALVPTEPSAPEGARTTRAEGRPLSTFVAQLIATAIQAPQTRAQRRGEPEDAISRYGAPRKSATRHTGLTLSQRF